MTFVVSNAVLHGEDVSGPIVVQLAPPAGLIPNTTLEDTPENRAKFGNFVMPENGFRTPWPSGDWQSVAANFRFTERFVIRSVAGLLTALCNEHPVGVGRSGHSILYLRPIYQNGWKVLYVNSWGEWGTGAGDFEYGFGIDSINLIRSSASWCFAARAVTVPSWQVAA